MKDYLRTLIQTLALVGIAEIAVRALDVSRLWALIGVFVLGYVIIVVVRHQRRRAAEPASESHEGSKN